LPDPAATAALGRRLGERLFASAVVALVGPLGAGKTFLTRAIAEGLGVRNSKVVTSPTFVLIQEYQGRLPIYHFDTYRLRAPRELADLGVQEYLAGDGVCLIEWADRVADLLPADLLRITLAPASEEARTATLEATGPLHEPLLAAAEERT
jgi:tRNA threonylcarbamoyladenosine biosynthesis protein TsaE